MTRAFISSILLTCLLCAGACKKLKRDNPLDEKNPDKEKVTLPVDAPEMKYSRFDVMEDNNSDKQLNKGELVKLKVYLKNTGSLKANKVRASFSCNNPFITNMAGNADIGFYTFGSSTYDYIDPGEEGYNMLSSFYLSFNIATNTPTGTVIGFTVNISDGDNHNWTDAFTATIVATAAKIEFGDFIVKSDNNSNQLVNAGESIKLQLYLKNTGSSNANKIRASVTCSSSFVSNLSNAINMSYYTFGSSTYDYIEPQQEGYNMLLSSYFGFDVSSSVLPGTILTFSLNITDESTNSWQDSFDVTVN